MRIYEYDIWDGDKGIIFANNMKEAKSLFKADYPNTKIATILRLCANETRVGIYV